MLELCISRCGKCAGCALGDADGRDERSERAPHMPVRPARSTPLLGQMVQGPKRILPLRAPGRASHEVFPLSGHQRGRKFTRYSLYLCNLNCATHRYRNQTPTKSDWRKSTPVYQEILAARSLRTRHFSGQVLRRRLLLLLVSTIIYFTKKLIWFLSL